MKLSHATALAVLTLGGVVHAFAVQNANTKSLIERDSAAICLPGGNSAPVSDVNAANDDLCDFLNGVDIMGGQQESAMHIVSTGDLSLIITNNGPDDVYIEKNTCLYVLNVLTSSCSAINNAFTHGKITYGPFTYDSEMLANHKVIESRQLANNSGCFAGNASAPVEEVQNIAADLCKFYVNTTVVPGEQYMYDYQIPEGDLIFKMSNICETPVKMDNETCYCGYQKVMQQCATADGRFVNGTIDNECLRLNTWVNATRIEQLQPGVSPVQVNGTNSTEQQSNINRRDDDDTFHCPGSATTPYKQDPRIDASGAIFNWCAQYVGGIMAPYVHITADVPLPNVPQYGPISFDYQNNCNQPATFNSAQCENGLLATVNTSYYNCEFLNGKTDSGDGCGTYSYLAPI